MVNDNLEGRGLYTTVFPIGANTVRGEKGSFESFSPFKMPIPFDTSIKPTRLLKKEYKNYPLTINDDGFNFMIRLSSANGANFANTYMLIEVGSPIAFAYEIGGESFSYPIENIVKSISVLKEGISFTVTFTEREGVGVNKYGEQDESWLSEVTIKNKSKDFSNGIEGTIFAEGGNFFDDESKKGPFLSQMESIGKENHFCINFADLYTLSDANENDKVIPVWKKNNIQMSPKVTYYYNENSFLNVDNPDKYLRVEDIEWNKDGKALGVFKDDEYVEMTLSINGSSNATDSFTGVNNSDNRLVKIIFPDEFKSLQPMVTMNDGIDFSKGRIDSKRFLNGTALFTFSDKTECIIPNPEDKSFQAKDKNGQILKGTVVGMELKKGKGGEALREQLALRKKNNLNKEYSFDIEGKDTLDSIAWVTGKRNDFIKMIIPTQDEKGNEMFKVVNINIGEL